MRTLTARHASYVVQSPDRMNAMLWGFVEWSDATTPRTDKPVRFRPCTKHIERMNNRGTFEAVTVGYIFRPC